MPSYPMGHIDWSQILKRQKLRRSPGMNNLMTESIGRPLKEEDLSGDLSQLMNMRGPEEAAKVVPAGEVRNRIREISKGNATQHIGGGIGATAGGLFGAGAGALATRLSKGPGKTKWGLLAGIPAAIGGYGVGKGAVKDQQLLEMLKDELGPGAGIKRAYAEEGFSTVLDELVEAKQKGELNQGVLKDSVSALKSGRGRGLIPSERHLIRKHVLGQPKGRPEDLPWLPRDKGPELDKIKTDKFKPKLNTPKSSIPQMPKPKGMPHWMGKKPLAIAGGAAALAGLGLAASKYWPTSNDDK